MSTKKVNAFDVIKKLTEEGSKKCRLAPLSNIIRADINGKRGTFTIGTEPEDVHGYMNGTTTFGGLLLIDREAFKQAEKELAENDSSALVEKWRAKAEKWDALGEKIDKYYPEKEYEEDFDGSEGLLGIGEAAAIAFGYL